MNFKLTDHWRGAEASTILKAPDLALHGGKNQSPATQFRPRTPAAATGARASPPPGPSRRPHGSPSVVPRQHAPRGAGTMHR